MQAQRTACTCKHAYRRMQRLLNACCILPAAWTLATAQRSRSAVLGPGWPHSLSLAFAYSQHVSYDFDLSWSVLNTYTFILMAKRGWRLSPLAV